VASLEAVRRGRDAYEEHRWTDACSALTEADAVSPLGSEDLGRLATACYLVGRDQDSLDIFARAFDTCTNARDSRGAARCTFWIVLQLILRGDMAQAGGWLARARRIVEDDDPDGLEDGYLLVPGAVQSLFSGDASAAARDFGRAVEIAHRFDEPDLLTIATLGAGQAAILAEQVNEGIALLDEAMVTAMAGRVSPILVGLGYCIVIEECQGIFDLRRAQEWTSALTRWCETQPDLVPYRGQCLVHRAEILGMHGEWRAADDEVRRACDWLEQAPGPAIGMALYQLGELHRLRGEFDEAEDAYRRATECGHAATPGLALLRLARGQVEPAASAMRRAVDDARDRLNRSRLLAAHVEVMLAAGDGAAARAAAAELAAIASEHEAPLLRALAAHAQGWVRLADGDAAAAVPQLRQAWTIWYELEAPYEAARVRVHIGLACRALGDHDTEELELDAARRTFERLGAAPDLEQLPPPTRSSGDETSGLTARELEVLALVSSGRTNREIASELVISEHTVARHVQNIFAKLGVSSRTAATAFAFEHHLV
jgi:ATP/maltotriose-dependent transcriptional regulator MalT